MSEVLIVEDDDTLRDALAETVNLAGFESFVANSGESAIRVLEKKTPSIVISDIRMDGLDGHQLLREIHKRQPGIPVILITAYGNILDAVEAMRNGAVDYVLKPFEPSILIEKIERYSVPSQASNDSDPVAEDPKSLKILNMARRVASSDATIMISGESGTGKEVLARYIHDHSDRSSQPFVAINCAAIPEQMLEATLFGYEKGAFTGAYKAMPGKFEQAQGGSLLLDEISEMDLNLQAKMLRVLQEKEVERIGGNKMIPLDVRVLATTNRDLKAEVKAGRFREDLYYRLNVFPLHWIPLRERKNDILPMAEYLILRHWNKNKSALPQMTAAAQKRMTDYDWPGNAREMDNVIQRALILMSGESIDIEDLHLPTADIEPEESSSGTAKLSAGIQAHEFDMIEATLNECQGSRATVAKQLGISERTLRYKLAKMRQQGYSV